MSTESPWAARAAQAETAVTARHLRRLWAIPGTRLGVPAWPAGVQHRLFLRWHYWWQAHLIDCLVDAELREPSPTRRATIERTVRAVRLRNFGRWTNDYYDDMAWLALALLRAEQVTGRKFGSGVSQLTGAIVEAWSAAEGGVPWRRGDVFRNTPANGPAAILLARNGFAEQAQVTADWLDTRLRIAETDLIADGLTPDHVDETVYTYCQGVVLGAETELSQRFPDHPSGNGRIHRLVVAVDRHLTDNGVLRGHGGGNGGLFTGILARYLALVARELPGDSEADQQCRRTAAALVVRSAESVWAGRTLADGSPVFPADWSCAAGLPRRGRAGRAGRTKGANVLASAVPERDLSVQLAAWMLFEATATV